MFYVAQIVTTGSYIDINISLNTQWKVIQIPHFELLDLNVLFFKFLKTVIRMDISFWENKGQNK